jgi:hypothetical protein
MYQALSYLNVEMLVIPSEPEVAHTWISCFGFEPLDLAMEVPKSGAIFWYTNASEKDTKSYSFR